MLNKIIFTILMVTALVMNPLYAAGKEIISTHNKQTLTNTKTVILSVPGMTCPVCPITVKKALKRVNGVKSVTVTFKSKTAVVTFNPKVITIKDLTKATLNVGYASTVKKSTLHRLSEER